MILDFGLLTVTIHHDTHAERHEIMDSSFNELAADFLRHTGKTDATLSELSEWSHEQVQFPCEDKSSGHVCGKREF